MVLLIPVVSNTVKSGRPWRITPLLSLAELQRAIPGFDWANGHSGVLLPDDVVDMLDELYHGE